MTMMAEINNEKRTFSLEILRQDNCTWQGTIFCVELNQRTPFRSALEMIRLIDSAVCSMEPGPPGGQDNTA